MNVSINDVQDLLPLITKFSTDHPSEVLISSAILAVLSFLFAVIGVLRLGRKVKRLSEQLRATDQSLEVLKLQEHRRFLMDAKGPNSLRVERSSKSAGPREVTPR